MSSLEGLLILDKAAGMTSHDVVDRVRRFCGLRRVGHAGTLDPLATGVLLVCVGRTTRLVEYLVGQSKTYEAVFRLGQTTNTYDADGEVTVERPFAHLTVEQFAAVLPSFQGRITQRPPLYSAIKKDGQPLYKLARKGIDVEVPTRQVTIDEFVILAWSLPTVKVRIVCSSGTYIRSLAHDIGEMLGCGGHIEALRRTAVGAFTIEGVPTVSDLTPDNVMAYLQPSDTAVAHLPRLNVTAVDAAHLLQGKRILRQPQLAATALVRAYDDQGNFIGIVQADGAEWRARKMFLPQI